MNDEPSDRAHGRRKVRQQVMKLLAPLCGLVLAVALLPVVIGGGDPNRTVGCGFDDTSQGVVLTTIRTLESGGDYTARARGSTASGAYQFIDTTWNDYGGSPSAWLAPPAVQDAKAADQVAGILKAHDGDISAIPVVWYIGYFPAADSPAWDTVPSPSAGNRLTPRQYQSRWLATYGRLASSSTAPATPHAAMCGPTGSGELTGDGWALPGPRAVLDATADQLDDAHHDYPAWDWLIPEGTPIYAVRGGTVVRVTTWNRNWWTAGCGLQGRGDCESCGVGVTIVDDADTRWTYCHSRQVYVVDGQAVAAGQNILTSGNTGRSGAPHLHLEIRTGGMRRCPQALVAAIYRRAAPELPSRLPSGGCTF